MLKKHKLNLRKLHLYLMKNKFIIINALMSVVILFAILFQSVHSYEHLLKELTEKKCLHKHDSEKEITHNHKFEKCFVCEFAFSSYISTNSSSFSFSNEVIIHKKPSFYYTNPNSFFTGISYSLRGPPQV